MFAQFFISIYYFQIFRSTFSSMCVICYYNLYFYYNKIYLEIFLILEIYENRLKFDVRIRKKLRSNALICRELREIEIFAKSVNKSLNRTLFNPYDIETDFVMSSSHVNYRNNVPTANALVCWLDFNSLRHIFAVTDSLIFNFWWIFWNII